MFVDLSAFDPDRDAKVPLKRTPLALAMRFACLTFELLFSRHSGDYFVWLRSMYSRRVPLSYPVPWITFDATRKILKHITTSSTMFEFGAGNSTLYWARRVASICATENHRGWLEMLRSKIETQQIRNVQLLHGDSEASYVETIAQWPHDYFDVVVVDGAYRRDCVRQAIAHVKPGGLLVVDNTDWHWFREQPLGHVPRDWKCTAYPGYAPMMGYKSETTIYVRPAEIAAATGN